MADGTRTLVLKGKTAKRLERLLKSGGYKSAEAAVDEALAELESRLSIEDWIDTVAVAEHDGYLANPSDTLSPSEARKLLRKSR